MADVLGRPVSVVKSTIPIDFSAIRVLNKAHFRVQPKSSTPGAVDPEETFQSRALLERASAVIKQLETRKEVHT
jgi:hypothetical protein